MQKHSLKYKIEHEYPALIKEAEEKGQKENLEFWRRALATAKSIVKNDKPRSKSVRNFTH